jgi:hypothetical protein
MLLLAPIDSEIYFHRDLHGFRPEARRRRVGVRGPVMALKARYAFDGAAQQAWGTFLDRRSQRGTGWVLDPRPDADGVNGRWGTLVSFTPSCIPCLEYSNGTG